MSSISSFVFYFLVFLSVYVQVFFFVTFLENRKKIVIRKGKTELDNYPTVTIAVPCWNEEKTVEKTVNSLLSLNYPQDKLNIFLIDDGSTDGTLDAINKFTQNPNIRIFHKKNGGKFTALNLALENLKTDFFGCLDADSFVDSESLIRIMSYFEKDPSIMAVAPSLIVNNPKNIIQNAQKAEYDMGIYFKKMLAFIGGIHVTPGPLTIFKKKVFADLGPYKHGHNTEDMEIAYRMQRNNYKIEQCNDAYVYTNTPHTVKKLFKQRLRWVYGFINNTIDYRDVLFKKKYGNFALFTLPAGIISIFAVSYLFGNLIYNLSNFLLRKITQFNLIGFRLSNVHPKLDTFFINPHSLFFISILVYLSVILSITIGKRMAEGKWKFPFDLFYFFFVFGVVAPFWLLKAIYNTILKRKPSWR